MSLQGERARELFLQGCNCAQSVICAYAPELGLTKETALRLASGFGGGLGRMRSVCGAVTGMTMVLGLKYGYSDLQDPEQKKETYALTQRLIKKFRACNGSILCAELLGEEEGSHIPSARTQQYYQERPCAALIACAADLLEELSQEKQEDNRREAEDGNGFAL